SFKDIIASPTVAQLTARISASRSDVAGAADILPVRGNGPRHVSILQEHVLRIERELPGLPKFNRILGYRLCGPLNVSALEQSLAKVVRRHESLRTRFAWRGERAVAVIARAVNVNSLLIVEDLAARTPAEDKRAKTLLLR